MPSSVDKLEAKNVMVSSEDKNAMLRLENYGVWAFWLCVSILTWLILAIVFPYEKGAWRMPAFALVLFFLLWHFLVTELGRIIIKYEDSSN